MLRLHLIPVLYIEKMFLKNILSNYYSYMILLVLVYLSQGDLSDTYYLSI